MLPGPAMDILEARAECRADKLSLTRGGERRVFDEPSTLLHYSILRSPTLVRLNLSARHSARASKMSMAGPGSMISEFGWLAFFDSELCSVRCGVELGLKFN